MALDNEHPIIKWAKDNMKKQDEESGVVFNNKPCQNGCNCAAVHEYHHGTESLKIGYQCLYVPTALKPSQTEAPKQ